MDGWVDSAGKGLVGTGLRATVVLGERLAT